MTRIAADASKRGAPYLAVSQQPHWSSVLPPEKSAQIAIVGAGVSGLLFANFLKARGYNNLMLLEQTNRYGGKTHSLQVKDGSVVAICELVPVTCRPLTIKW